MPVSSITLNNGAKLPQIGLGLWKMPKDVCASSVYNAIKLGYRLLDGAAIYENEVQVGEGIAKAISDGLVKREDLYVVSKLWNNYHAKEHVRLAVERTLKDLKVDYLDLYYIHFPIAQNFIPFDDCYSGSGNVDYTPAKVPIIETWKALEELVDEGLIKSIGISNFTGVLIQDLLAQCRIVPQVLQIEHHPYLVQSNLLEYTKKNGIAVTAYSSFGPLSFLEINVQSAIDCPSLLIHPTITEIAKKHDRSTAQVLLRWATQRGLAVIPKSANEGRLKENLNSSDFDLSQDELAAITSLDRNIRFNDPWYWAPNSKFPTFA